MSEEVKEKPKKPAGIEYVGKGRYINGIPTVMTLDKWNELPKETQKHLLKLGLYEVKYD